MAWYARIAVIAISGFIAFALPAQAQNRSVGTIPGAFDVSPAGGARYTIPIRVPLGTSGTAPNLSLTYDSQAQPSVLGPGWSLTGISAVTRGPRTLHSDGVVSGISLTDSDALYLDGQKLIEVSSSGSGNTRSVEYRKELDDVTRVIRTGADLATSRFLVKTKGGVSLHFDGSHLSTIRTSDGTALMWVVSRVVDTVGNYIEFRYKQNGLGDYSIETIRYTGHEVRDSTGNVTSESHPFSAVDFEYETLTRPIDAYVSGRLIRRDTRLRSVTSRLSDTRENGLSVGWRTTGRYVFEYSERQDATRFVLERVRQLGDDNTELEPTLLRYSDAATKWIPAKFQLPIAILAGAERLTAAFQFAHFSDATGDRPDLLFAASLEGRLEAHAYRNDGGTWTRVDEFKPPFAFATADGADLGALLLDVNNDGRVDILQSNQTEAVVDRSAYTAGTAGWQSSPGYKLPFLLAKDGKRVGSYISGRFSGSKFLDVLYEADGSAGFLRNTGSEWKVDPSHVLPVPLNQLARAVDVDCDGKAEILIPVGGAWHVYHFDQSGWVQMGTEFLPKIPANLPFDAILAVDLNEDKCLDLIVSSAQHKSHFALAASATGWITLPALKPPFDLIDQSGTSIQAVIVELNGDGRSDVIAHRVAADGTAKNFGFTQTKEGWVSVNVNYSIPIISDARQTASPVGAFVGDLDGDGISDIARSVGPRGAYTQVLAGSPAGFIEKPDLLPALAFARKDQQDRGVRFIDVNADGLPDVIFRRDVVKGGGTETLSGAYVNTGRGWVANPGLIPPLPFAGDKIAGNPVQFLDVDFDGYIDLLYSQQGSDGSVIRGYWRNEVDAAGGRRWSEQKGLSLQPLAEYPFTREKAGDLGVRFIDINGDGRPDMLVGSLRARDPNNPEPIQVCTEQNGIKTCEPNRKLFDVAAFINDGKAWIPSAAYTPPLPFIASGPSTDAPTADLFVQLVDVNGDGLPDLVARFKHPHDEALEVNETWLNTGTGWRQEKNISAPTLLDAPRRSRRAMLQWIDLNGDGLADLIFSDRQGPTNNSRTWLSTGAGFALAANWQVPIDAVADRDGDPSYRVLDLNGDGLPDILYARMRSAVDIDRGVYFNTGSGWLQGDPTTSANIPAFVDEHGLDQGVRVLDVDGNGLLDVARSFGSSENDKVAERQVLVNAGRRAGIVTEIAPGYGARTTVQYQTLLESSLDNEAATSDGQAPWLQVYEPPAGPNSHPIISPVPAAYVVRRTVLEGGGFSTVQAYRYGEYRVHAGAMRSLGYGWRESYNSASQILARTEYSQNIDLVGRSTREATCWIRNPSHLLVARSLRNLCPSQAPLPDWIRRVAETSNDWRSTSESVGAPSTVPLLRQTHLAATTTTTWELDGALASRESTELSYDRPASLLDRRLNVMSSRTTKLDGTSLTTENRYDADNAARWFYGRVTRATVVKEGDLDPVSAPARKTEKRVTAFSYFPETGLLQSTTTEPGDPLSVTTTYARDRFGNIQATTVSAPNEQPRTTTLTLEVFGRYVKDETNPLLHATSFLRRAEDGQPSTVTDPNFLQTTFSYDGYGRLLSSKTPSGVTTSIDRLNLADIDKSALAGLPAAYAERTTVASLPPVLRIFDSFGRLVRTATEGFTLDGTSRPVYVDLVYDRVGRLAKRSLPYEPKAQPRWSTIEYDPLGRPVARTRPDGKVVRTNYVGRPAGGRIVTSTNVLGRITRLEINTRALPVVLVDQLKGRVAYEYDAGDRLESYTGPTGAVTRIAYNRFGQRNQVNDPDLGVWTYRHDAFGQLVEQRDPKGQSTILEYDYLSRLKRKSTADGSSVEWDYDTAPRGIGSAKRIRDPNRYEKEFFFDAYGRLRSTAVTIGSDTFTTTVELDEFGRNIRTRYPAPPGANAVVVENMYDRKGFLKRVTSENGLELYWEALELDSFGRTKWERYGNGSETRADYDDRTGSPQSLVARTSAGATILNLDLRYDDLGNLEHRSEQVASINEGFSYDLLDRLVNYTDSSAVVRRISYDEAGRITTKAEVGTYVYRPSGAGKWQPYHAVLQTKSIAGVQSYTYDANGNIESGAGQTFTYTAANKLAEVSRASDHWSKFEYDPSGDRYRQLARNGDGQVETIYVGPFERIREFDGPTTGEVKSERHRYYIAGPDGNVAILELSTQPQSPAAAATKHVWYMHRDQLGSVVRVTNEKAQVAGLFWYDPWGRRMSATITEFGSALGGTWRRGFTGHEHLTDVSLIHMNGRVYDFRTGMFVSADPVGLITGDSQSLGRYRYALNNPLRYIDPSGMWDLGGALAGAVVGFVTGGPGGAIAGAILGGHDESREWIEQNWREVAVVAVTVGVTVATGGAGCAVTCAILSGMAAGAAGGGVHAALYGGSLDDVIAGAARGAVVGGVSAGAFYGVGSAFSGAAGSVGTPSSFGAVLAHGAVGGSISAVQGGNFWAGFAAGAFTKASSAWGPQTTGFGANVVRAAIVGGSVAAIAGGKFANGAVIGAFSYALNDALHMTFDGKKVVLKDERGDIVCECEATSGRSGVSDTSVKDAGPIPEGEYTIKPEEVSPVSGFRKLLRSLTGDWGSYRVPLHPSSSTNMFDRSGVMMHGGQIPGSAGCIDVGSCESKIFPIIQQQKDPIRVKVDYPKPPSSSPAALP